MRLYGQRSDVSEFRKRFSWHAGVVVLAFLIVLWRLFELQVLRGDEHRAAARENIVRKVTLNTTRGVVRDREGRILASSRPSYNVHVVPSRVVRKKMTCVTETEVWTKLTEYLRIGDDERKALETKLNAICADPSKEKHARKFQAILVREDVNRDIVAVLETHKQELRGVTLAPVPVRYYPFGSLSAHTLGYMAEVDAEQLRRLRAFGYMAGDRRGAVGVERHWESYLRGQRGWEKTVVDARGVRRRGEKVEALLEEPRRLDPIPGRDLRLTLDIELVKAIDRAMRGQIAGAVAVVDVRTGRVLALYSKPSFDPNVLSGGAGVQAVRNAFRRLYGDPLMPTLDKTMSGSYPPGSTYKPFSALAALRSSLVDPRLSVQCRGFYEYGKRRFRCTHVHGLINMRQAIVQSCNVYFYQLGEKTGLDRLAREGLDFGFGQKTGIGVNPESAGRIPTYSWYATHFRGQYRGGFTLNAAIGQGATTVTVLQLALAYAALANGGTLYQPQIVRAVETSDGVIVQDFAPRVRRRVKMNLSHWNLIRSGLHGVVSEPEGTAYHQRLPEVDMSGKTGTAQTSHRTRANIDSKNVWYFNRDHAWFASYYPSDAPEISVVVLIEHGGVGGKNAAPVAFAAAKAYAKFQAERLAKQAGTKKDKPKPKPKPRRPRRHGHH
jgi:penicillin-binding protein 2